MYGLWLTGVARRLLDEDTFQLIVSPAIADLQFEAPTCGVIGRARAYIAVGVALAGAIGHDLLVDLRLLHEDAPMLIRVVLMQVAYYSCMLTLPFAGMTAGELVERLLNGSGPALAAGILAVVGLSSIPTLLCFWPARRVAEPREPTVP